jgi:hypothetical protein
MTPTTLEQRYRRLLACYPTAHRDTYGEEMIGVLLASAPADRQRPGVADTFDLFGGAARIRLRSALTGSPDPGWRNALALASLIAPFLLAALVLRQNLNWIAMLTWNTWPPSYGLIGAAILLVPVAFGLIGLRYIGALAAIAVAVWYAIRAALFGSPLPDPRLAAYLVLLLVEAVALAASPGPRYALGLVTRKGILLALPWIATAAYTGGLIPTSYPVLQIVARIVIVIVAIAGLPALITASGRRLLVLIVAIPGSVFVVTLLTFANVQFYDMSTPAATLSMYLPPFALAALAFLAAMRSGRPSTPRESGAAA